jgi:methylenetetrahydrofolate reductase (NADPH)
MTTMSKLAEKLKTGRPALTAECFPPRGADAAAVKTMAAALPQGLDAVVVADNPEEVRGSATACAALLAGAGREPVLSVVTRDRNRIALESDVLGASLLGVRNFLCLSGDHQTMGVSPQAAGAYDIDSIQFTLALTTMAAKGVGFDGRKVDPAPAMLVGAVAHPYLRPMELNLIRLKKKVAAGAAFLLTQAVFDLAGFAEWLEAVRAAGLDKQAVIIASVMPLPSVERAKEVQARKTYGPVGDDVIQRLSKAADPAAEGVAIAGQIAAKLKAMPGVRGIHVLCGGCEALAAGVIKEAGLA